MAGFCLNFTIIVSFIGAVYLSILGVFAYLNFEALRIDTSKVNNMNSAISLWISAGFYLVLALLLLGYLLKKGESNPLKRLNHQTLVSESSLEHRRKSNESMRKMVINN